MKQIQLPEIFNVATHFVDRHIHEGRESRIAFECGDERVTYRQLYERVNRAGNALKELGIRQEERIGLLLLDTSEFAYCFFGGIKIGAVPIPINTMLKPQEYEYILNDSRARVLIVSESLLPQVQAIAKDKLRYLKTIVVFGKGPEGTHSLQHLLDESSPELEAELTSKDDAAFWLYSSGSTGFPKGCVHLHHDMVVCSELYAKNILQITENDRFFSVAKMFFAYGLGNGLYFALSVGATSILWPGSPSPPNVFAVIEKHKPTLFFSVPSNYASLLSYKREGGQEFDLSTVRHGVSAGEALPATIFHRFKERFGVEILDAIGSTEALHMFIANRPGAVRPGSSGEIMPGYEARIVDENGHDVPDGEVGSLLIKGDSVCSCYWNQHEKTKEVIQGHWIRTGDKYYRDPDGYYWYVGRNDDMMKVKGMWVSPIEIESTLLEHPMVQEAAAIGHLDGNQLIKPAAYLVLKESVKETPQLIEEIRQHVSGRLAAHKCPQKFEIVKELPKTATGKIQRYKLRELVLNQPHPQIGK
ncbi:MAG TPA: benzoate-CoA ligase family protein [Candidatus Angelobacter sp.]|nr:benzoate-CoA ligase family protein [Candidatus Angelobacter sp.]HKR95894.1 benzoate-CoA ligase family protein [Candidatus Angelobacter sp.]